MTPGEQKPGGRSRVDRRWGEQTRLDQDATARDRLITAAEECMSRLGLERTSMEAVASAANVSRGTVYRYFTDRESLIVALMVRASGQVLGAVEQVMQGDASFAERTVDALMIASEQIRRSPSLMQLLGPEASPLAARTALASSTFFEKAREVYGPWFAAAQIDGAVPKKMELDVYIEWQLRVIISLVTLVQPVTPKRTNDRQFLEMFVKPAFER